MRVLTYLAVAAAALANAITNDQMAYRNPYANRPTPKRTPTKRLNRLVYRQRSVNAKRMERFVR